jgi:hypothetical protein
VALVARAAAVGQCEPIPDEKTRARAMREGWIVLPLAMALNSLAYAPPACNAPGGEDGP